MYFERRFDIDVNVFRIVLFPVHLPAMGIRGWQTKDNVPEFSICMMSVLANVGISQLGQWREGILH